MHSNHYSALTLTPAHRTPHTCPVNAHACHCYAHHTTADIRNSYLTLAKLHHPDKQNGSESRGRHFALVCTLAVSCHFEMAVAVVCVSLPFIVAAFSSCCVSRMCVQNGMQFTPHGLCSAIQRHAVSENARCAIFASPLCAANAHLLLYTACCYSRCVHCKQKHTMSP